MGNLELFPVERPLAPKLRTLADQKIWLGTSSWKYEGWLGQVYTHERYQVRGKFSKQAFEKNCISEYAETFPTVCGDFMFYQFPTEQMVAELFSKVPPNFKFAFKVTEDITVRTFPSHPRYGSRIGTKNTNFLDAEMFATQFLLPLRKYSDRVVLIFEFGSFSESDFPFVGDFLEWLAPFLHDLPQSFKYAVEIRNEEFLGPDYLACLREYGAAHVLNAWTRMPPLEQQIEIPGVFTADHVVIRGLLRRGRYYERAVQEFTPYKELRDPNPETRGAIRSAIEMARAQGKTLFAYLNNRLEGNAPMTIEGIVRD